MNDHSFCREQLALTLKEVRLHLSKEEIKEAWAWRSTSGKGHKLKAAKRKQHGS